MTKQERLHRQDPKRAEPIRNMTAYLRNSHSWGDTPPGEEPGKADEGGKPQETIDDVLTDGVNLGYKIIDDHIHQGRRVAEELRRRGRFGGDKGGPAGGEAGALLARLLGLTKDMGSLWYDSLEMALKSPRALASLAGGHPDEAPARGVAGSDLSVEVASSRRTQVTLSLPPGRTAAAPLIHALHAANPAFPPLTGVRFQPGARGPVLLVEIPDGQPASTYTGVVVEQDTNEPVGTLVIRVLA